MIDSTKYATFNHHRDANGFPVVEILINVNGTPHAIGVYDPLNASYARGAIEFCEELYLEDRDISVWDNLHDLIKQEIEEGHNNES